MSIQETIFGPKRYLAVRKSIETSQVTNKQMYDEAGTKLGMYIKEHSLNIVGPWSVLYFLWDEATRKAEIAIAFPIEGLIEVNDPELSIVDVPETKAVMEILNGPYEGIPAIHDSLIDYVKAHNYETAGLPIISIEEFLVTPMQDSNPANLITNIYCLYN